MHAFVNCLLAQIISMLVSGIVQILAVQMDAYSHTDVFQKRITELNMGQPYDSVECSESDCCLYHANEVCLV